MTVVERFMSKVLTDGLFTHWLWTGARNSKDYGNFRLKRNGVWTTIGVHRVSYELFVGPIPPKMDIDHVCETTLCINPAHLQIVTPKQNHYHEYHGHGDIYVQPWDERVLALVLAA